MPLVVAVAPPPVVTTPHVQSRPPQASWFAPDGAEWPLTASAHVLTEQGPTGLEAAPREVTRQPLATGGGFGRWSYAAERLVSWPLEVFDDDGDPDAFTAYWRRLVRAFTSTTPAAGEPRPGRLRVTRADGTWRELTCLYLEGLGGEDSDAQGYTHRHVVLSLVAPDPWFYGADTRAATWEYVAARSYLSPYETVSPGLSFGESTLQVAGDVEALPRWEITGPATDVSAALSDGRQWTLTATLAAGETRVVDVAVPAVTDADGVSRIGELAWPSSQLWPLPPGEQRITLHIGGAAPGSSVRLTYRPRYESA